MLAFFRRIRKSLISSGSARKYLLYAIGEILLVVIGILIAINLNNSNQSKISDKMRDEKITKLRRIIYNDSTKIDFTLKYNQEIVYGVDSLVQILNSQLSRQTYLQFVRCFTKYNMQYRTIIPDLSVYNELVASGQFSKIKNDDLKNRISTFYSLYVHFNDIADRFIDALIESELQLYYKGILSRKYLERNLTDEAILKGFNEFSILYEDPLKKRILENHLYELKDTHFQVIYFYEILLNQFISGIPLKPENPIQQ